MTIEGCYGKKALEPLFQRTTNGRLLFQWEETGEFSDPVSWGI